MTLPERSVAIEWVGKSVVDPSGAEIGPCTAVFADDDTDLPEWLLVDRAGTTTFIPLVDAAETGGVVRVSVAAGDVSTAPQVGENQRISKDEEAALYRHYGIKYSQSQSESLLPAGASAPTDQPVQSDQPEPVSTPTAPSPPTQPDLQVSGAWRPSSVEPAKRRSGALVPVTGAAGAAIGAVVAVRRLRATRRTTPADRAAQRARAAAALLAAHSAALAARSAAIADSAGPVLKNTSAAVRARAAAANQAAAAATPVVVVRGRAAARALRGSTRLGTAVGRTGLRGTAAVGRVGLRSTAAVGRTGLRGTATVGRTGAGLVGRSGDRAARLAASAAGRVAHTASSGVAGGARVGATVGAVPEVVSERSEKLQKKWRKTMGKLMTALGFGAGYVLGTRDGRARYEQIKGTATKVAERPEVQQAKERVKAAAGEKLQASTGQVRQRAAEATGKLRRSGSGTGGGYGGTRDFSSTPSYSNGGAAETPAATPPVMPGQPTGSVPPVDPGRGEPTGDPLT